VEVTMKDALRIAGYAGTVLLLFGLLSFAFSGRFDLWTAVHVAGGGVCVLVSLAANLGGVLRAVAARGTRQRAQAVTGTLVFAALLIVLNVLAARFPRTWDVTEAKVYTLGDKTLSVLDHLDKPVQLAAFVAAGDRGHGGLDDLLKRYAARSRELTFRMIDPEKEPQEADRFGVREAGVLAAQCGSEKAQSHGNGSGAFDEGEVTSLILKVARPGGKRLYSVTGHGEPEVGDLETAAGLGGVAAALKDDNIEIRPLFLSAAAGVPDDAAAVILAGPVKALIPHEQDALRAYLAKGGRLLALINPGPDPGLGPLLADYKLALDDTMIVDKEEIAFLGARLGLDPIVEEFPPHPITKGFKQRIRFSQARSITIKVDGGLPGAVAQPLARTREPAWGERGWKEMLATGRVAKDGDDAQGPLLVAATSMAKIAGEGAASDTPGREARVVLVGDADWVANGNLGAFFNREFLVNVVHWLTGSEDLIVGPPKTLRPSRLDMTTADQRNLFRFGVLLLPEVLLIGGIVAWLRRRSL
jgi:ABC-type uncharacterized transport system involved in gliding motility auxiliary subunit